MFLSPRNFKLYSFREFRKKDAILIAAEEKQLRVHLFPTCPPPPATHTQSLGLLSDLAVWPKARHMF